MINVTTLFELARLLFRSPQDKADIELADAAVALFATPEFSRVENAIAGVAAAYNVPLTRDAATGHIATLGAPASAGGHPSMTNRGEI